MRLIDADAFAKRAYEVAYPIVHGINDHERGLTLTGIAQLLDEQPTVEPKQGHWIRHGEPPWYVIECSECGAKWQMSGSWDANNYCGNCGARMGEQE